MGAVILLGAAVALLLVALSVYGLITIVTTAKEKQYETEMSKLREEVDDEVMNAFEEYEEWEKASILATNPKTASEFANVVRGWRPSERISDYGDS